MSQFRLAYSLQQSEIYIRLVSEPKSAEISLNVCHETPTEYTK